jgi:hypothetical protein
MNHGPAVDLNTDGPRPVSDNVLWMPEPPSNVGYRW